MAVENTLIKKPGQISDFVNEVHQRIKDQIVWYNGSSESTMTTLGFPLGYLNPGTNDPGKPDVSELTDTIIVANTLASSFQSWMKTYTKARKLRYIRIRDRSGDWYNHPVTEVDKTEVTHLVDATLSPEPDSGPDTGLQPSEYAELDATASEEEIVQGKNITDETFNNFIDALYSKWESDRDNIVTYTYTYCHDNCHSSCHDDCHSSGRNRR